MDTEKEIDLPASETLIVNEVPDNEAVTEDGLGGLVPSSFCCNNWLISARRHVQSFLVVTFVPDTRVNGSGSFAIATVVGLVVRAEHVVDAPEEVVGVLPGVVVEGGVLGVGVVTITEVYVEIGVVVGVAVPGKHWLYQSFEYTQTLPVAQVLGPVQPMPPPLRSI